MKRIMAIATLAISMLALTSGAALAHDHTVPKTTLQKGKQELQRGIKVGESFWNYPAGDGLCANENAIYQYRFRAADNVAEDSKLRVRVFKAQRPHSFRLTAYRDVDGDGLPAGKAETLQKTLKPVFKDGRRVAWDVVFSVDQPRRHYYLVAEGHWQDREGCGGDQFAFWSFHVKTTAS